MDVQNKSYAYLIQIEIRSPLIAKIVETPTEFIIYPFMLTEFGVNATHDIALYRCKDDVEILKIFKTKEDIEKYVKLR